MVSDTMIEKNENESLASIFKKLEQAAAQHGLSLSDCGVPDGFVQYVEDLEDNCTLSPEDIYRKGYEQKRGERCVKGLLDMCIRRKDAFRESLLLSGCLKNPLGNSYKEEDYVFTMNVLMNGIEEAKKREYDETDLDVIYQCLLYTDVLYKNALENGKYLQANQFSRFTLVEQLLMICMFIQDQTRLTKERLSEQYAEADIITGMEPVIAPVLAEGAESQESSIVDNFEAITQYFNNIIRLLYYTKKNELKADCCGISDGLHPFQVPEFRQIVDLSMQRVLYCDIEERFRYSNWNISTAKELGGQAVCLFQPGDKDAHIAHLTAAIRRRYQMTTGLYQLSDVAPAENEALDRVFSHIGDRNDLGSWVINKFMFQKARQSVRSMIIVNLSGVPYLLDYKINGNTVKDIANGFEFLRILSDAYIRAIYAEFDPSDYAKYQSLTPIVSLEYLIGNFSKLYGCKKTEAKKIIGYYIFDGNVTINGGDIFTRPLIRVSKTQVILCQSLIEQMNLARNLQKLIKTYNVDFSESGRAFEESFKTRISKSQFLSVCEKPVEFQASDGKTVEFDFVAVFDDCLLLAELKCLMVPYSDAELYDCRKTILTGVEQVKRRRRIVLEDWEKFKRAVGIDLPDEPYPPEKIICIVCTNLYDFTGLEIDCIPIVDDSALCRYFTHPNITQYMRQDRVTTPVGSCSLWKDDHPSVPEFLKYLSNPFPNSLIVDKYKKYQVAIPAFEGAMPIAFEDYHLSQDPFRFFMMDDN